MMTVKQVSSLTGVSIRTLQFYDEIGLFKPVKTTDAGYRLYDYSSLEVLQQILFFKELDFTLKEIKAIMESPQFDIISTFKKQRELLQMKRDRLNTLLELLDKLLKGERCMDFKNFDMSDYFRVLDDFKVSHTDEVIKNFGSIEQFDNIISKAKSNEDELISIAIKQFGSVESFTKAVEKNMNNFLTKGTPISQEDAKNFIEENEVITKQLTSDLTKDVTSSEIQEIVNRLISLNNKINKDIDMGDNYWSFTAENYISNPMYIKVNDKKYGEGASKFIGYALKAYLDNFKS